jgi:hypothetical protein
MRLSYMIAGPEQDRRPGMDLIILSDQWRRLSQKCQISSLIVWSF